MIEQTGKIYHGEGAEAIANAVVLLAIEDYRKALLDYKTLTGKHKERAKQEIESIEAFFESENGQLLSRGYNKRILRLLLKEYEKEIG